MYHIVVTALGYHVLTDCIFKEETRIGRFSVSHIPASHPAFGYPLDTVPRHWKKVAPHIWAHPNATMALRTNIRLKFTTI